MANDEWRVVEILKLLRQCVVCPFCGVLVATQEGINNHITWHNEINTYVAGIDSKFEQFSNYIINPTTGLEKRVTDRLDTITNYVIAPTTGLEPRTVAAITASNNAIAQLRTDATNAINALTARIVALEAKVPVALEDRAE